MHAKLVDICMHSMCRGKYDSILLLLYTVELGEATGNLEPV